MKYQTIGFGSTDYTKHINSTYSHQNPVTIQYTDSKSHGLHLFYIPNKLLFSDRNVYINGYQ